MVTYPTLRGIRNTLCHGYLHLMWWNEGPFLGPQMIEFCKSLSMHFQSMSASPQNEICLVEPTIFFLLFQSRLISPQYRLRRHFGTLQIELPMANPPRTKCTFCDLKYLFFGNLESWFLKLYFFNYEFFNFVFFYVDF